MYEPITIERLDNVHIGFKDYFDGLHLDITNKAKDGE